MLHCGMVSLNIDPLKLKNIPSVNLITMDDDALPPSEKNGVDIESPPSTFAELMSTHIQSKAHAEESLLLALVGAVQKLETELTIERTERKRLQESIAQRNETDDEQLAQLTKTVDTLLFNLQGYESSAIAREDDTELERANQAKRRSLEKKRQLLKKQEEERLKAKAEEDAAEAEEVTHDSTPSTRPGTADDTAKIAEQKRKDDEETIANNAAFAKAKALANEQDRIQDLKRKEKEIEIAKKATDAEEARRWYAASIIQVAFRHFSHMKIWKSAVDFGRQRVKDGNAISARIAKLEKMTIDLNAYRQRQEDELIEAQRLALEMKKQGKFGSPELQLVIDKIEKALDNKVNNEQCIELTTSLATNIEQVESVRTEQADLREEMRLSNERAAAAGLSQVQDQLQSTKNELASAIAQLEEFSTSTSATSKAAIDQLTKELKTLQHEHAQLGQALGVATTKDPNAVDIDAVLESLENKMEAIRIAKLDDEDLTKKMEPLMEQLGKVNGSLNTLQSANKKVTESTIINQQKLANEAKKTKQLVQNMEKLKKMTSDMSGGNRGGGGSSTDDERKEQHGMLMEDITSRLSIATEGAQMAAEQNQKLLKNLDGRLRSHSGQVGTTLERLQKEVGSKVSETELRDLQDRIKNEFEPTLEMVGGISNKINTMTTKDDVNKMISILRKKQTELSAIGVKCLVCSQNVPGGMASPSAFKHKQFPLANQRQKSLETLRGKTFDARVSHKLSDLMTAPLRRSGALRQVKGKWAEGWGGNVSQMPQDGYGPVGWTRIESNEAYVDRMLSTNKVPFGSDTRNRLQPETTAYLPTTGHKTQKTRIKMKPRHAKSNPVLPPVDIKNGLEFGLTVKKRSHVLNV